MNKNDDSKIVDIINDGDGTLYSAIREIELQTSAIMDTQKLVRQMLCIFTNPDEKYNHEQCEKGILLEKNESPGGSYIQRLFTLASIQKHLNEMIVSDVAFIIDKL